MKFSLVQINVHSSQIKMLIASILFAIRNFCNGHKKVLLHSRKNLMTFLQALKKQFFLKNALGIEYNFNFFTKYHLEWLI